MPANIQVASLRSGVTPHVIRIWERRYGALTPSRTGTNRRLYCEEEITRLRLLRELTECGHRIGSVARLETDQLEALLQKSRAGSAVAAGLLEAPRTEAAPSPPGAGLTAEQHIQACMEAARAYDGERLRRLLQEARLEFGLRCCVHQVVCPLIERIGLSWQQGSLRPGHEHMATAVLREFLVAPVPGSQTAPSAPEIIITTPAGEIHELGALLASVSARDLGWRVTYLGPNLPTEEIVACARGRGARAVALSVVYPPHCPVIEGKLRKIREMLPSSTALLVGGRAAGSYAPRLADLEIHWAFDLTALDHLLVRLAMPTAA